MSELPVVTTIIPTFRRPAQLRRAIQSVLSQTYPYVKVCVLDNCSNDQTGQVVREIAQQDPRVSYICHSKNIGVGPNFQYGLDHVETPFFSLLSDDDFLLPSFYENAIKELKKFPQAACFAGRTIIVNEREKVVGTPFSSLAREGIYEPAETLQQILQADFPPWTSILFRTEIKKRGLDFFDLDVCNAFDIDYTYRICTVFPVILSRVPCAVFVSHGNSCVIQDPQVKRTWEGFHKMIEKVRIAPSIPTPILDGIVNFLKNYIHQHLFSLSLKLLIAKKHNEVLEIVTILQKDRFSRKYMYLEKATLFFRRFKIAQFSFILVYHFMRKIRHLCKTHSLKDCL